VPAERPSRTSLVRAAAVWLHACVLLGILTTLEYLRVPVLSWLRDHAGVR